jgi:hypothetical protein
MPRSDGADYAAVLADLREQRARLDAAIHALEAVMDVAHAEPPMSVAAGAVNPALTPDYDGMTVYEAAVRYLQAKGVGQRTTQILKGLQRGGIALTGKSPINSLGAILNDNLRRHKHLVRLDRGLWGLSSWQTAGHHGVDGRQAATPTRGDGDLALLDDQPLN